MSNGNFKIVIEVDVKNNILSDVGLITPSGNNFDTLDVIEKAYHFLKSKRNIRIEPDNNKHWKKGLE